MHSVKLLGSKGLSTLETIVAELGDCSRQCGQAISLCLFDFAKLLQ